MKKIYLVILAFLAIHSYAQNFPVAVDDTAQVMNQKIVQIYPLLNDYDPDGDTIEILKLYSPGDGEAWREDSTVFYKSEWFVGWDDMEYKVAKVGQPGYQSDFASIHIEVIENPDVPTAVDDSLHARYLEPTILDIMANDYDPNSHELKIYEVDGNSQCELEIIADTTMVLFTSGYDNNGRVLFRYTLRERSNEQYLSNEGHVMVYLDPNPELPVTVDDTFEVIGGIPSMLDVLANDIYLAGDTIEVYTHSNPQNGSVIISENMFQYTSQISYSGNVDFEYRIRNKNKPWLYSEKSEVSIQVNKNPDCPIGEPDHGSGMAYTQIDVEVLSNDHDPLGDEIEIMDVKSKWGNPLQGSTISFLGDIVSYTPPAFVVGADTAFYRIRKKNNTPYYSEWIPIIYDVSQNPGFPTAVPDSVSTKAGIAVTLNFLKNDIIPDSIEITSTWLQGGSKGLLSNITDSTITYTPFSNSSGRDEIIYTLLNFTQPPYIYAIGKIYIDITENHSYDSLNINNINAGFNASGMQFARIDEILDYSIGNYSPHFEVPKGSGKHSIFCNTLWMGGMDNTNNLHLAGERYRSNGWDYQPGPVANTYDSAFFYHWYTMWKLNKTDVEYHRNNWWKEGYEPIRDIAEWPGNGDPAYGMAEQLAPYFDEDGNGFYDPMQGDYPLIRGDQCIFFMTNDDKLHTNTESLPLKLEIHGMGYAFDAPDDSILNNTIFVHYSLINRSDQTYDNTYFGIFTDIDLGYAWDDRIACDVSNGSYYAYNGEEIDGNGGPGTYGDYPPAQSVSFLAGPFMDPDQEDNPEGGCDFSVNGLNFGNGILDDERYGMTRFTNNTSSAGAQGDPNTGGEYYMFLKGLWKDAVPVTFGEGGHPLSNAVGPECRFMFPGASDPMNWGTDCSMPNGGYNTNGKYWTEEQADFNPSDRHGVGICGPFTFGPGDIQEVDIAYMFANSFHSADSSKELLISRMAELRQRVLNGEIIIPNKELDIPEGEQIKPSFKVYPNPAGDLIFIETELKGIHEYKITNILGTIVQTGRVNPNTTNEINISGLKAGVYLLSLVWTKRPTTVKFIKW